MNLLLVVGTPSKLPSRKRLSKKIKNKKREENHGGMKMLRSRVKKKGDDVSHASLDEISHSKKTHQNKEAGAQWAY